MGPFSDIEQGFIDQLKNNCSETVFNIWFKDLQIDKLDENEITISTTSAFKKKILQEHHISSITSATEAVLGFSPKILLEVRGDSVVPTPVSPVNDILTVSNTEKENMTKKIEGKETVSGFTFDNFIVGDSNKFAHAACYAVAQSFSTDEETLTNPNEEKFNPLFIYGQSGLGKTHLLYAITNEIKEKDPSAKLVYIRGEDFLNDFIENLKKGTPSEFRDKFRNCDVLLIDDIHIIAGKEAAQEEFFNTFNVLYENQKQIILTSDRPPREIKNLSDRLVTRFEWGLTADIQPPTPELRAAIIRSKAEKQGIVLSNEIIRYMADNIKSNIRSIEGAIRKLYAMHKLTQVPITLDNAKRALADVQSQSNESSFIVDRIFKVVSTKYDVSIEDIKSKKRQQNIAIARHMCMYLLRKNTTYPLTDIGSFFGCQHATVILACNHIEELFEESSVYKNDFDYFQKELNQ